MRTIKESIIQDRSLSTLNLSLSTLTSTNSGVTVNNFYSENINVLNTSVSGVIAASIKTVNNSPILNTDRNLGFYVDASRDGLYFTGGPFNIEYQPIASYPHSASGGTLTRVSYTYTGSNQSFTVPANTYYIYVKMWGAGGSNGRAGGWSYGANGGGGGHSRGIVPVNPGETLTLVVGRGGINPGNDATAYQYGQGGPCAWNGDSRYGGHGGGYAGIFRGNVIPQNALLIAGGGGGGGSQTGGWETCRGGAGGGAYGHRGDSPQSDAGLNAGSGATPTGAGFAYYTEYYTRGGALKGGAPWQEAYGGGGGAGWFGGGGGGPHGPMAGGGGGSGFVHPSVIYGGTFSGSNEMPAFFWDADLRPNEPSSQMSMPNAHGGVNIQNNSNQQNQYTSWGEGGGHAFIVIYY